MSLPSRPEAGLPISADAISRLIEETQGRTVGGGNSSVALVQHRGGGIVLARPSRGMHPGARISYGGLCPFRASVTGTGLTRTVKFRAGTVNGMLPSNYATGVSVPSTGTRYLTLDLTFSSGVVTAAAFSASASPPSAFPVTAGTPPTSLSILVAIVIDANPVQILGCGNIQLLAVESFRLQKSPPVDGQLPYDVYYTWELGLVA